MRRYIGVLFLMLMAFPCVAQPPGSRGGPRVDSAVVLIDLTEVQQELDVNRPQLEMLESLQSDLEAQLRGRRSRRRRDPAERQKQREVMTKLLKVVLDKDQSKRFSELQLQFESLYAIDRAEFAKELELSEEQIESIRDIREDIESAVDTDDVLEDVLSYKQIKKWQARLGRRFAFTEEGIAIQTLFFQTRGFGRSRGR